MKKVLLSIAFLWFLNLSTAQAQESFIEYENNPVLSYSGQSGTFDQMRVYAQQVVKVGNEYWMYYSGIPNGNFVQIGLAKSIDGKTWTRYSTQPVFRCGENTLDTCVNGGLWSSTRVWTVSVEYDGTIFKMWYAGNNQNLNATHKLGYATSVDGVNWVAHPDNPVFDGYNGVTSSYISVLHVDGVYRLYYNDNVANVLRVKYSDDGIDWTGPSEEVTGGRFHSVGYLEGVYYGMLGGNIYFSDDGINFNVTNPDLTMLSNSSSVEFGIVGDKVYAWRTTNYGNVIWSFVNTSIDLSFIDKTVFFAAAGVTEENEYPLYTQVESPYPSLLETAQWADDAMPCGTIAACGCTISSLVSGADYFDFDTDVLGQSPTPATINSYLKSVGGYSSKGILSWLAASAYFGEFASDGTLTTRLQYPPEFVGSNVSARIQSAVESEDKIVLAFEELNATTGEGHFVWVPAYADSSFIVKDPLWYETQTSNDVAVPSLVRDYNSDFDEARIYTVLDEPESFSGTSIEVLIRGTAELLYQNALGEKVGYEEGGVVVDLDRAVYGNITPVSQDGAGTEFEGGKMLLLYEAGNEFTIDVIGTGLGEYEMEFFTISETGVITTFSLSGQTIPGVTTTWSFNLETGETTEEPISYEQFLGILDTVMDGYTDQQRAFFLRWAEKMYSNMEEKTVSQALQSIEVYKKLLVAKKVESPVLSSVLDLLAEDVKS